MPDSSGKHVFISGLTFTISKLKTLSSSASKYAADVMLRCVQEDFMPKWLAMVELQDHSLEDLAKEGHPYAVRFGADTFVHPDSYLHEQSGTFLASTDINTGFDGNNPIVEMTTNDPDYKYIRFGTSIMRIRDPASAAIQQSLPAIRQRWINEMKGAIVDIATR